MWHREDHTLNHKAGSQAKASRLPQDHMSPKSVIFILQRDVGLTVSVQHKKLKYELWIHIKPSILKKPLVGPFIPPSTPLPPLTIQNSLRRASVENIIKLLSYQQFLLQRVSAEDIYLLY